MPNRQPAPTTGQHLAPDLWPVSPDHWLAPSAANLAETFTGTAERGGFRTARWDDAWAADPGLPEALVNSVTLRRPLTVETAGDLTGRLDAFYGGAVGGPWTIWSAWPTPDLVPLGYTLVGQPPLMVRPPGGEPYPIPPGLRIVEVEEEETLAELERTFIEGYGLASMATARPGQLFRAGALGGPSHFWIGYEGDHPVTTAVSTVGEGVVGIYFVATLPEARGRGYGAAITDAAARVDPSLPALLQSSDLGRPVYERLGFEIVSRYDLWLRPRGQVKGDG